MPLVINQMPGSPLQFPGGMNAREFALGNRTLDANTMLSQQQSRQQQEMAMMMAMLQLVGQRQNLDVERELRQGDQGIRREELQAMLGARKDDNALSREGMAMADARAREQNALMLKQMDNYSKQILEELAIRRTDATAQAKLTGVQAENLAEQTKAIADLQRQAAITQYVQTGSGQIQAEEQGQLRMLNSQAEQASSTASTAFSFGQSQVQQAVPGAVKSALSKLDKGEQLEHQDIINVNRAVDQFKQKANQIMEKAPDLHTRVGMAAEYHNVLDSLSAKIGPQSVDQGGWLSPNATGQSMASRTIDSINEAQSAVPSIVYRSPQQYGQSIMSSFTPQLNDVYSASERKRAELQRGFNMVRANNGTPQQAAGVLAGIAPTGVPQSQPAGGMMPPSQMQRQPQTQPYNPNVMQGMQGVNGIPMMMP